MNGLSVFVHPSLSLSISLCPSSSALPGFYISPYYSKNLFKFYRIILYSVVIKNKCTKYQKSYSSFLTHSHKHTLSLSLTVSFFFLCPSFSFHSFVYFFSLIFLLFFICHFSIFFLISFVPSLIGQFLFSPILSSNFFFISPYFSFLNFFLVPFLSFVLLYLAFRNITITSTYYCYFFFILFVFLRHLFSSILSSNFFFCSLGSLINFCLCASTSALDLPHCIFYFSNFFFLSLARP